MTAVTAIKKYFESGPQGRKVTTDELRELTKQERQELGRLACEELGETFQPASE